MNVTKSDLDKRLAKHARDFKESQDRLLKVFSMSTSEHVRAHTRELELNTKKFEIEMAEFARMQAEFKKTQDMIMQGFCSLHEKLCFSQPGKKNPLCG